MTYYTQLQELTEEELTQVTGGVTHDLYAKLVDSEYEEDEIDTVTEKDFEHLLSTIKINY